MTTNSIINKKLFEGSLNETSSEAFKYQLKDYLNKTGYGEFAKKLDGFRLIVTDIYDGKPLEAPAMIVYSGNPTIYIHSDMTNPDLVSAAGDKKNKVEKMWDQLSLLIRHEMLHYMLVHMMRFLDHLDEIDPSLLQHKIGIKDIKNAAADWDLSRFYSEKDNEIVSMMTWCNSVVGGLLLDVDHPEWIDLTYEQIFDKALEEYNEKVRTIPGFEQKRTVKINRAAHSQEYTEMYNLVMKLLDDKKYSLDELSALLTAAENGEIIIDHDGNIIIDKGE